VTLVLAAGGQATWVIFLSAFGGGLFGAALQSVAGHFSKIAFSDWENQRRIQRSLRYMLYRWLERGSSTAGLAFEVFYRAMYNNPPIAIDEISARLRIPPNFPIL
jgi:hypothetical protein